MFDLAFLVAVPFWALMILAPRWSWTGRVVGSPFIVVPPLLVYVVAIAPILPEFAAEMLRPDVAELRELLGTADGTTAVWAHLIAFDLFVGSWMYRDSRGRGISALVVSPLLVLTVVLAPFGLLAYLAVRALYRRDQGMIDSRPIGSSSSATSAAPLAPVTMVTSSPSSRVRMPWMTTCSSLSRSRTGRSPASALPSITNMCWSSIVWWTSSTRQNWAQNAPVAR